MRAKNLDTIVGLSRQLLKLTVIQEINNAYIVLGVPNEQYVFALEIAGANIFKHHKSANNAFTAWNNGRYDVNGVFYSDRVSRILLELLSIEDALQNQIRFAILINSNLYWLKPIADSGKAERIKFASIKRLTHVV